MSKLNGKYTDMGDIVIVEQWLVKGRHWRLVFKVGAPRDVLPDQRPLPQPSTPTTFPERIDLIMDLGADKKVALTATFADEIGHPVPTPEGATVVWSVDNNAVVDLTIDLDTNVATAAATGELGNAVVSVAVTLPNGTEVTGDLLITVVPGEAERVTITAGEPEEVTPDGEEPPVEEPPAPVV